LRRNVLLSVSLSILLTGAAFAKPLPPVPYIDLQGLSAVIMVLDQPAVLGDGGPSDADVAQLRQDASTALNDCTEYKEGITDDMVKAKGATTKAKQLSAAVTAGVTLLGGLAAGGTAAGDNELATQMSGYGTAVAGVGGGIITILVDPGAEIIDRVIQKIDQITVGVSELDAATTGTPWRTDQAAFDLVRNKVDILKGRCSGALVARKAGYKTKK
jgi:hypothetical protein